MTDTTGHDRRGRLLEASDAGLVLAVGSDSRRFDAAEIDSVRVRTSDGLLNGALIGAAIGGGVTSLIFLDNECHDDPACYAAVFAWAGVGALAGLGVDALIHGNVVVYRATGSDRPQAVAVAAILGPRSWGARLRIAF